MTVIAWDGKTLAADKRASSGGLMRTVTKIRRIYGNLVGVSGDACHMEALFTWFASGADPAKYPSFQNDENKHSDLLVVTPQGEIHKYEHAAFPIRFEDRLFAMGSGRDYALAAMHLGKSASEAVEV